MRKPRHSAIVKSAASTPSTTASEAKHSTPSLKSKVSSFSFIGYSRGNRQGEGQVFPLQRGRSTFDDGCKQSGAVGDHRGSHNPCHAQKAEPQGTKHEGIEHYPHDRMRAKQACGFASTSNTCSLFVTYPHIPQRFARIHPQRFSRGTLVRIPVGGTP